jgi:hypothetical protein
MLDYTSFVGFNPYINFVVSRLLRDLDDKFHLQLLYLQYIHSPFISNIPCYILNHTPRRVTFQHISMLSRLRIVDPSEIDHSTHSSSRRLGTITQVKIWDTATGKCLQTLEGHSSPVTSVAFSHDSRQLASASDDCTVRIWDAATGECPPRANSLRYTALSSSLWGPGEDGGGGRPAGGGAGEEQPDPGRRPDHPSTLTTMNNLASTYRAQGRTAEAAALQEELHEGCSCQ